MISTSRKKLCKAAKEMTGYQRNQMVCIQHCDNDLREKVRKLCILRFLCDKSQNWVTQTACR